MGMVLVGVMPGMAMGVGGGASAPADVAEEAEVAKTSFDVKLENFDAAAKVKIIKEALTFTALGLKEAIEGAGGGVVGKDEAEQIVEKLKSAGGIAVME